MSLRGERFSAGVSRKNGAATMPARVVRISLRRERSTFETLVSFSKRAPKGKPIAAVGQIEAQFMQ